MSKSNIIPHSTSAEDIKVMIKNSIQNESIGSIHQITLKDGPRAFRFASIMEIINPVTNQTHHYSLRIDSWKRLKSSGWSSKADKSVSLTSQDGDEISKLKNFLVTQLAGNLETEEKEVYIVSGEKYTQIQEFTESFPDLDSSDKIKVVQNIFKNINSTEIDSNELLKIFSESNTKFVKSIGIAAKLSEYRTSYNELSELIRNHEKSEHKIQKLLELNPWIFGSEYSELLERRKWTRDENLDFMLRRTSDNFLELIEIKTPDNKDLFIHDSSHDSYYPSSNLSKVIGQVINYLVQLDRERDTIISKDRCDPLKIRAKIIIGRDGDKGQLDALRTLNAHLIRIEVITFDQLLRIAEHVLELFEKSEKIAEPKDEDDDIPF